MKKILTYLGTEFDDFISDEFGVVSKICKSCATKHSIPISMLGDGEDLICGVKGCVNVAEYSIEFVSVKEVEK